MNRYIVELFSRKPLLKRRQYYFRIKHANGETLCHSEGVNNLLDRNRVAGNLAAKLGANVREVES